MNEIIVLLPFTDSDKAKLEAAAPCAKISYSLDKNNIKTAEIIIGPVSPEKLREAENLRLLQLGSAGADAYLGSGILPDGVILTNATGAYGLAISEYMLGAVLTLGKKFNLYINNMREHLWLDRGSVMSISGAVVLIIGLGNIGGDFARLIKNMGAYTIGIRRVDNNKPEYIDELYLADKIDEVLPRADIIALALPGGKGTDKIISRSRLDLLKNHALIINAGRGNAVDTEALCDALEAKKIGGAALDVTDPEPLPPDHRLWTYENIIITPHVAGFYHHPATLGKIAEICIANVKAYISGERLKNIVDINTGYARKE